ncbi:formate dehydrogenase%2C cytochrome B556 subunit [Vibrio cholerae]|nr:formate dehydrogenase%2C cytochrome B556 subunit [Vibrio cholerae]
MEGALEGMVTGKVDETWAKEHHDLWYEEVKRRGEIEEASTESQPASFNQTKGEVSHESR